ncbi:hypothetical protein CNMCM5793_006529 [Aspergillus hiratsukae]|uniref:Calcineurin subunit B n=1 Tax=Aspergillus hiratsukae TaxID=1194566 RepID=A0A8H6P4G4_9EURO|nr:hypothetical protein CNMCM5793_006529 [Aspergillus hiratsukae]KAF7161944.1 hypothetical protein CNMCM6106_009017 [Aspergillus hiratsukae]
MEQPSEPNNAAMYDARRRRASVGTSQLFENIVSASNFDRDEVDRLRKRFMKLDKDASGTIDRDEFLSLPQVSSNPLATRMIAIFDEDGGGDVDFQEFVSGLSAFSSKGNKEEKLRFAFKVYDIDRDGYISNGELFIVLKMMVGNNLKDVQLQQIVDKTIMEADKDRDGKISFEEFTEMVENTDVSLSMTLTALITMPPSKDYHIPTISVSTMYDIQIQIRVALAPRNREQLPTLDDGTVIVSRVDHGDDLWRWKYHESESEFEFEVEVEIVISRVQ